MNALCGLQACIRKELLLLSRDLHGLALLFLMPLAFLLVMSLALQNQFATPGANRLKVAVIDQDQSDASHNLLQTLNSGDAFKLMNVDATPTATQLDSQLRRGDYAFAITIRKTFGAQLATPPDQKSPPLIELSVAPDSSKQTEAILLSSLRAALAGERLQTLLKSFGSNYEADSKTQNDVALHYAYEGGAYQGKTKQIVPTSVQQSVPAWLVFAAFFVVVPLSNTFIRERQQGTLRRLRSTNLSALTLLLGKLVPYFGINQLQVVLMLLAGRYLVPLLGGDALQINGSLPLLALMAVCLSLAALGLALLIAVSSRTTEQAILLGGTGNIVLAAIGGIMVPKFIMPPTMQAVANWSPMSWGLEGFLDVMLRSGGLRDIAPEALGLTALGLTAILLAWFIQARRLD